MNAPLKAFADSGKIGVKAAAGLEALMRRGAVSLVSLPAARGAPNSPH